MTAMCDVDNPLFGKNGAAYIFAHLKGADADMVVELDNNLRYLAELIKDQLHIDIAQMPGAGAAGGAGAGVVAFLGG